jgi:2-dehydro-3-deoxyphosphogluconate aldolase/(4S)-4-hydroxy-2-oxoglutarate aldolase
LSVARREREAGTGGATLSDASRVVEQIRAGGVLAIVRLPSVEDFLPVVEAIWEGGVGAVEWAFGEPERLRALERGRIRFGGKLLIGAGTILTADAAKDAIRAGAQFLAAPILNPEVLRVGQERDVAVIPGAFTATEIANAWHLGAGLIKLFPAAPAGPAYIRHLHGSLPYVPLIPSGGVTLQNAQAFIRAGAAAVGVGNELVVQDAVARRAFAAITERARAFAGVVQQARGQGGQAAPPVKSLEGPDVR